MDNAYQEFLKLRQDVMKALEKVDMSLGCKSYEGTFELTVCYPCFFDDGANDNKPEYYQITLHCYRLGPARHYKWGAATLARAVDKAKKDIYKWIQEEELNG